MRKALQKIKWFLLTIFSLMLFPVLGLQDIFGGLGNILGGGLGGLFPSGAAAAKTAPQNMFRKILSHADWWDTTLETASGAIDCKAGVYTVIGRYKVPAQQAFHFGFGSPSFPDNQGYAYMAIYDDTATNSVQEHGALRLVQRNAVGTVTLVVAEFRTEQLCGDTADRKKQMALPEQVQFPLVGEDSYLELHFKPDATDTIVKTAIGTAAAKDIWNMPVSCYQ